MSHKTNPFQKLITNIMAIYHEPEFEVKESVKEKDPKSGVPREIDVHITQRKSPFNKIFIECRYKEDGKTRQPVDWIDQMAGKYQNIPHSKLIAVSNTGFTSGAIPQAKAKGIELLTLIEAEKNDWEGMFKIDKFGINIKKVPLVKEVVFEGIEGRKGYSLNEAFEKITLIYPNSRVGFSEWFEEKIRKDESIHKEVEEHCDLYENVELNYTFNLGEKTYEIKDDPQKIYNLRQIHLVITCGTQKIEVPLKTHHLGELQTKTGEFMLGNKKSRFTIKEKDQKLTVMIEPEGNAN